MHTDHLGMELSRYDELASILYQAIGVASCYNNDSLKNILTKTVQTLNAKKSTRVFVVGSIASGKSSIINVLLGETAVPTGKLFHLDYWPCTIMYGAQREAILYFKDDISSNEMECLPKVVKEYVQAKGASKIPSLRITIDELEEYTTPNFLGDVYYCLPYSKIEIRIPNELLKNQFELTELPGFNNSLENQRLCIEHLCADDIIIMIMSACFMCSMDEMDFIKYQLKPRGITPIFIVTRYDCIKDSEKEGIKRYAEMKLSAYSPYEILFVSTNQGIESIEENDKAAYVKSNIESLKILLSSIIRQRNLTFLNHLIEEMRRKIHPYTFITDSKNDTIDFQETEKLSIIKTYNELNHKRQFILDKTKLTKERDIHELEHSAHRYFCFLAEQIPYWIYSYTPHHQFGIPTKANIMRLVQEITNYIENKIRNNIQEWSAGDLNTQFKQMSLSCKLNIEDFLLQLYKDLNDNYPSRAINMITSNRTAQIKEGLLINNELPNIIRNCEMDDSPCVNIIGLIGCTFVPLKPKQIIEIIKKEVSTRYCEYITKESTGFISDIISVVNSHFDEFNHIISDMIQEDIDYLEYCNMGHEKLATAPFQYQNVLRRLDSYIAHLLNTSRFTNK